MMRWSDVRSVEHLLNQRREKIEWLDKIKKGMGNCTIQGRYLRDDLSEAQKERLDDFLGSFVTTEIAHIDAELAKLGVNVTDAPAD